MQTNQLFTEITEITEKSSALAAENFIDLDDNQRTWRPQEGVWNIREIFAHLNEYARFYHSAFEKKIDTTRFTKPRENFISSPLGRSAWKSMKLGKLNNVKRKFRALKNYDPLQVPSIVKGQEVEEFIQHQAQLIQIFERAQTINIQKSKIGISMSKIVRLRMGDALQYVVYHNERHVQQALNLLKHPNFPR